MVKAWLSGLAAYSVVGQTDLFSAFAMYLSKYRFVLLGAFFRDSINCFVEQKDVRKFKYEE